MSIKETKTFLEAALRNPRGVSTIFPSSPTLAQKLVDVADLSSHVRIVEIGCGTGAITKIIQKNLAQVIAPGSLTKVSDGAVGQVGASKYFYSGVEIDPTMVEFLKETYPHLNFYAASAAHMHWLQNDSIDAVISSLPWTLFSQQERQDILKEVLRVLKPGGTFTTFICVNTFLTPSPYKLKKFFRNQLSQFQSVATVWTNIPPAIVYKGQKPL